VEAANAMTVASATVVVPASDRSAGLARLFDALGRQHAPGLGWDVVVVDNGATGGIEGDVSQLAARLSVAVRVVREPRRGASHARNRGIAEVVAPITVFVDDDVVPEPDWLCRLVEPLVSGEFDGVGGRVLIERSRPLPAWFFEGAVEYLPQYDLGTATRPLDDSEFLLTASAAFRTALLRASGGFDPSLGPRPGAPLSNDDLLIGRRCRRAGGRLGYVGAAVVVHELSPERLRLPWMLQRFYCQGRSDWLIERVDGDPPPTAGLRAVGRALLDEIRAAPRRGPWRRSVVVRLTAEVAYALGFSREMVVRLVRGAKGEIVHR
jgi:glucosyl-dolichyl phosphate glucuronosyltransferase